MVAHKFARGDGQGRINYEIVRYALAKGHAVTLLASEVDADLAGAGARWIKLLAPLQKPAIVDVVFFERLVNRELKKRAGEFDLIVGNGSTLEVPHDVNLCQFVHGAWIKSPVHVSKLTRGPYAWYQWMYSKLSCGWEKKSYAFTRFVVAPSDKIRQELIGIGVPDANIRVIYNGVDLQEFSPGVEDRQALGLPTEKPLGLFVGDIRTPRKNLDTVLKAMTLLPQLKLAVAGAAARSPFPEMAKKLGVADRVTFLGFRRDIGRLMRAADYFVFPSRYEAGTLVLLEALATGLPVVTARTAGGCEVMGDHAGRIIEDPNDPTALANAMNEMACNESARHAASKAAREVAEKYSWTEMARQYLDLFAEAYRLRQSTGQPAAVS